MPTESYGNSGHYGVGESRSRFGKPRWIEVSTRLAESHVLSIAVVRAGHAWGQQIRACMQRLAPASSLPAEYFELLRCLSLVGRVGLEPTTGGL